MLSIDSNGVNFSGTIEVDGHTVSCKIGIKHDGIFINGLTSLCLRHIDVEKAKLDIHIYIGRTTNETSRENGFSIIRKTVNFANLEISVVVYTVSEHGEVQWTVYGELDTDLQLSHQAGRLGWSSNCSKLPLSLLKVIF
jgi:hypothetical protein